MLPERGWRPDQGVGALDPTGPEGTRASDSCGTESRSASIAAIAPIRASVDSAPHTTRSNPICCMTWASA